MPATVRTETATLFLLLTLPVLTGTAPNPTSTGSSSKAEPKEKKSSKAWIAGAVVGPLLGLALIGLVAFFLIRRKKKSKPTTTLPPQSGAAMAPAPNPSQPPAGVAGYTDTKPQFTSPHQSYYDPGLQQPQPYPQQGGFGASGDVSPATQYATPAPVPYGAPSPPPQQQQTTGVGMGGGQPVYGSPSPNDTKMAHMHAPAPGTSELGGDSAPQSPTGRPVSYAPAPVQPQGSHAPVYGAELQGSVVR
jgi:LPXTG-motif cell wall-anchored protein